MSLQCIIKKAHLLDGIFIFLAHGLNNDVIAVDLFLRQKGRGGVCNC